MKWPVVLMLVGLIAVGLWLAPKEPSAITPAPVVEASATTTPEPVGTSGGHDTTEDVATATLTDLDTITGATDSMTFVGTRVDLHADVQEVSSDHAFWIGSPDNRVLVVLSGSGHTHRIVPVRVGQRATVEGVIRRVPSPDHTANW